MQGQLPERLASQLECFLRVIEAVDKEVRALTQHVSQAAPAVLPRGLGQLTHEIIELEIRDWHRLANRRQVGSYAGLTGGVSGSGEQSRDLSITKAGNRRLSVALIECAWRLVSPAGLLAGKEVAASAVESQSGKASVQAGHCGLCPAVAGRPMEMEDGQGHSRALGLGHGLSPGLAAGLSVSATRLVQPSWQNRRPRRCLNPGMHYVPIALPFFVLFWLLFGFLVVLIQIGILQYVFESMGVSRRYMFSLLVLCLLGSYVNISVAELPGEQVRSGQIVDFFGMEYVVPVLVARPGTVIAVNVGGAVIPFLLSLYLMGKHRLYVSSPLAVAIVAVVVHHMARGAGRRDCRADLHPAAGCSGGGRVPVPLAGGAAGLHCRQPRNADRSRPA